MGTKSSIVLMVLAAVPAAGIEIYGGGVYVDACSESPLSEAVGGELQVRQAIGDTGFYLGLGVGAEQWRVKTTTVSRSFLGMTTSQTVSGDVKIMPVSLIAMYKKALPGFAAIVEAGATYNHADIDAKWSRTNTMGSYSRSQTVDADYSLRNLWTFRIGAGVEIPIARKVRIALTGGYQWLPSNDSEFERLLQGAYVRMGIPYAW